MFRNILAFFFLAAVVGAGVVRKEREGFIFLGSTTKEIKTTVFGKTTVSYQDWDYWMSVNAAGYSDAKKDCLANLDQLIEINTVEERDDVEAWLQDSDQTASLVWVGARYDSSCACFVWETTGEPVADELWGPGQPSQKKPNSRVAAEIVGQIVQLKTQANTVATRYICEGV